jgi:hypothetical protein
MIINLSNLKQLDISHCELKTPAVLFELLKDASQLSSLDIHSDVFKSLFDDDELCKYLNKMITKLNVKEEPRCAMDDSCDLNKFSKTFSNLEQLICILDQLDSFLFLLKHLPKLSYINVFSFRFTCWDIGWIKELNLSKKIISDYHHDTSKYLTIWFTKNIS